MRFFGMIKYSHLFSIIFLLFISISLTACMGKKALPPYASNEAIKEPTVFTVFAKEILSGPDAGGNIAFTPDGTTMFFEVDTPIPHLLVTHYVKGKWSEPKPPSFASPIFSEGDLCVSPDGNKIYYTSTRLLDSKEKFGFNSRTDYNIWVVEKAGNDWGTPYPLPSGINATANEYNPTVDGKGNVYFNRLEGENPNIDIYVAKLVDGNYLNAEPLEGMNTVEMQEIQPDIDPNGKFLLFTNVDKEETSRDIEVSYNKNGVWSKPIKLSNKVNKVGSKNFIPYVSPNGKYLFFKRRIDEQNNNVQIDIEETGIILDK